MQCHESTDEITFSRGNPAMGWIFTVALVCCLSCFLGPLLQPASFDGIWHWMRQASLGSICFVTVVVGFLVLLVLAAVNGIFACCCIRFDKTVQEVTRDWRLGPLHRHDTHSFEDVAAVAYVASNNGENDAPSYSYRLKCYFKDDRDYDLTTSGDQQAIIDMVQRLRRFLNLPVDGTMHYEAERLARKVGEAARRFAAVREQHNQGTLSNLMAGLLTRQMEVLQTTLERTIPKPVPDDASADELLDRVSAEPMNATLHLQVAEIMRKQQDHENAAAFLERAVAIMGTTGHDEPVSRRATVHPVDDPTIRPLWAKIRGQPANAQGYFDLSLALRAHAWAIASAACLTHAVLLRHADGKCSDAEAEHLLREATALRRSADR
jgi:hypothetical protein